MLAKQNLTDLFSRFDDAWSPKVVGQINQLQLKVVKLRGEFVWHQHQLEDELFLVVRGTLRMRLRDGDLVLGPGELVIVPHGVEHCPVAEGPEDCQVVLLEPATTLNTGDVRNERTVETLEHLT